MRSRGRCQWACRRRLRGGAGKRLPQFKLAKLFGIKIQTRQIQGRRPGAIWFCHSLVTPTQSFGGKFEFAEFVGAKCQNVAFARRRLAGERMRLRRWGGGGDPHQNFTGYKMRASILLESVILPLKMNREGGVYF